MWSRHSFPTRRSSDLEVIRSQAAGVENPPAIPRFQGESGRPAAMAEVANRAPRRDRKSTRLNSSHVANSYAVFCLKKKIRQSPIVNTARGYGDHGSEY